MKRNKKKKRERNENEHRANTSIPAQVQVVESSDVPERSVQVDGPGSLATHRLHRVQERHAQARHGRSQRERVQELVRAVRPHQGRQDRLPRVCERAQAGLVAGARQGDRRRVQQAGRQQ